jgi:LysM repeat protein
VGDSVQGFERIAAYAGRAAIGNALTQGIGVVTGLQSSFNWKSVAASAVGAGVGQAVGPAFGKAFGDTAAGQFGARLATGMVAGGAAMLAQGGRVAIQQVAVDAFGSVLGNSLVDAMMPEPVSMEEQLRDQFWGQVHSPQSPSIDWANPYGFQSSIGSIANSPTSAPVSSGPGITEIVAGIDAAATAGPGGTTYTAQRGDSISRILGTSSPQAIGNFMRANGLTSSTIYAGQDYFIPDDVNAYGDSAKLGQGALNVDNARLQAIAKQAEMAQQAQAATAVNGVVGAGGGRGFVNFDAAEYAAYMGTPSDSGGSSSLSGWGRTQAHALGVYDAGVGTVESAGYSFGVVGTPESRAAWALQTVDAGIEGIRRLVNDPSGTISGWWGNLTGDDPQAIRQATAQGTGIALGVAGGVAMGRLQGTPLSGLRQTGAGGLAGAADEAYALIRSSSTDVATIAENTGIKASNIQKVKDHLFYDEHLLDRYESLGIPGEMRRFDSNLNIANAWQRLEMGTFKAPDMQLLRHETAEAWYMRKYGPSYNNSHNAAQMRYPSPLE